MISNISSIYQFCNGKSIWLTMWLQIGRDIMESRPNSSIIEMVPDVERQTFDTFPIKNLWKK